MRTVTRLAIAGTVPIVVAFAVLAAVFGRNWSWGGVPVPAVANRPRPTGAEASRAPAWFRAMDRNGDGVISPREFLGPPEVFRKLDLNGDGVISPEEAVRAGGR